MLLFVVLFGVCCLLFVVSCCVAFAGWWLVLTVCICLVGGRCLLFVECSYCMVQSVCCLLCCPLLVVCCCVVVCCMSFVVG